MITLAEVAAAYDAEADKAMRGDHRRQARETAAFLRGMVANRAGADPAHHKIEWAGRSHVTIRWVQRHGYKAVAGYSSAPGVTIQRGDEPVLVAAVGDTLRWDGERITIS